MLNFNGCDEDDVVQLEKSYKAIQQKDKLSIVLDESEKNSLYRQVVNAIGIPDRATFYFQNLFKLTNDTRTFFIAQCLIDFGYPESPGRPVTWIHKYHFQIIGFAKVAVDLGKTYVRPETKLDKRVSRFIKTDLEIKDCESFSNNYYVSSNKVEKVREAFDKEFVRTIGKYRGVELLTKADNIYIFFDTELHAQQSRIVEDIFDNCKWLTA